MNRKIHIRLHVGGYWAADGTYNGGETKCCRIDFEEPTLRMLESMIASGGFPENMNKFSYFPFGIVDQRKDVCSDTDVVEMVNASSELESINLFAVRADDPYLDDVLIGGDEEEDEQKSDDETDFYRDDYVESEDSDDDEGKVEFQVGQEFISQAKCREAIEKYAVNERVNIHFQRSERKKVAAECVADGCEWRLYASINSRSPNMVVRSYKSTHSCYATGTVDLYTAAKISAVSCTCRTYDVSGIPCCHIMSAMYAEFKDTRLPETVVSDWYSIEKWKLCYNYLIFPVNGMELWDKHSDVVVMPPPDRIMPDRPKKNDRIRDPSEKDSYELSQTQDKISEPEETPLEKIVVKCSNCGAPGHNKRTCKEAPVNPPNPPKPPLEFPSFHANIIMTCSNCRQTGHNKRKCKLPSVPKPPNMSQGRPSKKPKKSTPSTENENDQTEKF